MYNVSGVGETIVNKTDSIPFLGSLHFSGRRKTTNKQIYNMSGEDLSKDHSRQREQ